LKDDEQEIVMLKGKGGGDEKKRGGVREIGGRRGDGGRNFKIELIYSLFFSHYYTLYILLFLTPFFLLPLSSTPPYF
jgi:hypothetical protein